MRARLIRPSRGEEMMFAEMTEETSRILGTPTRYQQTTMAPIFKQMAKEHGREFDDFFWQHIVKIADGHQSGVLAGTNDIGSRRPAVVRL